VSVSVPQLDVVLLLAVVVVLLLPDVAVVAITLPARTTVVIATETTNVAIVTVAIVHAALTTEIVKSRKIVNAKKVEKTVPMVKTAKWPWNRLHPRLTTNLILQNREVFLRFFPGAYTFGGHKST